MFKAINALPGHEEPVQFTWKFIEDHFSTTISIFEKNTGNPGRLVYQEKMYMLAGNTNLRFTWDGKVNQPNIGKYAQNGRYLVRIVTDDAPAFPYEAYVSVYNGSTSKEYNADDLIQKYNNSIPVSRITRMQNLLTNMQFYEGEISGSYNVEFLSAVIAYESVINNWSSHVSMDVTIRGLDFLPESGEVSVRLLNYAIIDNNLGRDAYGTLYDIFYAGDLLILSEIGGAAIGTAFKVFTISKNGVRLIKETSRLLHKGPLKNIIKKFDQNVIERFAVI